MILTPGDPEAIDRHTRSVMESRGMRGVAESARQAINETAGGAFTALLYWLSKCYAEGYSAGWKARARHRGEVMPPPGQDD